MPAGAVQALTDAGWWLTMVREAGERGTRAVLEALPPLAAGRRAREARASDRFTEWDGFVPAARARLDPRVSGQSISVTQIEGLVGRPFRDFLEHGLGVEILEEGDPDHDEWLDAMQKGSALQEVYATLGRAARPASGSIPRGVGADHGREGRWPGHRRAQDRFGGVGLRSSDGRLRAGRRGGR